MVYIYIFTWELVCYIFHSLIFSSRIVYRIPNLAQDRARTSAFKCLTLEFCMLNFFEALCDVSFLLSGLRWEGTTPWFADISTKPRPFWARIGAPGPPRCSWEMTVPKLLRRVSLRCRFRMWASCSVQQVLPYDSTEKPISIEGLHPWPLGSIPLHWGYLGHGSMAHHFLARIRVSRSPSHP